MTFLSAYRDRPSTLKPDHEIVVGERKGNVHSLNDFDITVWEDGEVTARRKHYVTSDPRKHFPNMSVSDGAVTFPIEDLVSFILERISAEELAEGIIADDEARAALVYKMSERYSSPTFTDGDRRKFLDEVQEQVHAKAIDDAMAKLNEHETAHRARDDHYRWRGIQNGHYRTLHKSYQTALYELREAGVLDDDAVTRRQSMHLLPDALEKSLNEGRDPAVTESVGPEWHESRDYWRRRLEEIFAPAPEDARGHRK